MKTEFVTFELFNKLWDNLGLTDDDLRDLEVFLSLYPEAGSIIQGTGGVRKIRWSYRNKGKSGGIRVLYIDFVIHEKIYLLMVYPKNQKENITPQEKVIIKKLVNNLKEELRKKYNEKKL